MMYTLELMVMSIGIIELFQLVSFWSFCILICLIVYVYFQLVSSISVWYSFYFIHIYLFDLYSRYKFSQILFMLELEFQLYFNWFSFQLVSYFKPMHEFSWCFIKGEKIQFSYFYWYLIPLPHFMMFILSISKLFIWLKKKNTIFWYQDVLCFKLLSKNFV